MADKDAGTGTEGTGALGALCAAARFSAVIGAVGSSVLMLRASEHPPLFLLVLFIIWLSAPFAGLLWAIAVSIRWSSLTRMTLCFLTIVVTLASLAIYAGLIVVAPPGSPTAFRFVVVAPASVAFVAAALGAAAVISRLQSGPRSR